MGRKKGPTQELEQHARGRLRTEFSEWILNSHDEEDFGFDYEVRFAEKSGRNFVITPNSFFLQLKASERFDDPEHVYTDLDVDYLIDDCLTQQVPVVLMIYERDQDNFYWCILQSYCWDILDERNEGWVKQKTVRVKIEREPLVGANGSSHRNVRVRNEFKQKLNEIEERINFRKYVKALEHYSNTSSDKNGIIHSSEIENYKQGRIGTAEDLLKAGAKSRALENLIEVYEMPEKDESTLDAILKLLEEREMSHPAIAFIQNEFANDGIELARKLGRSDDMNVLREYKGDTREVITKWMPGARVFQADIEEEFLILTVQDWAPQEADGAMWVALMQYEDGVFYDQSASAIAVNEEYEFLSLDKEREPLLEACPEGEHNFDEEDLRASDSTNGGGNKGICLDCGLSRPTLQEMLGHRTPIACRECGDIVYEFEEGLLCEDCSERHYGS